MLAILAAAAALLLAPALAAPPHFAARLGSHRRAGGGNASDALPPPPPGGCCAGGGGGHLTADLTVLASVCGAGLAPMPAWLAVESQQRLEIAFDSTGAADVDASVSGLHLRRCKRTGTAFVTVWSKANCVTVPVPEACVAGARMCVGAARTPWPVAGEKTMLDATTGMSSFQRFAHGAVGTSFPMGTLFTLTDSCMPLSMIEATGPAHRGSEDNGGAGGGAALTQLFDALLAGEEPPPALLEAIAALNVKPTDLSWMSATFSNASATRPTAAAFRSPARCRLSFPEDAQLD